MKCVPATKRTTTPPICMIQCAVLLQNVLGYFRMLRWRFGCRKHMNGTMPMLHIVVKVDWRNFPMTHKVLWKFQERPRLFKGENKFVTSPKVGKAAVTATKSTAQSRYCSRSPSWVVFFPRPFEKNILVRLDPATPRIEVKIPKMFGSVSPPSHPGKRNWSPWSADSARRLKRIWRDLSSLLARAPRKSHVLKPGKRGDRAPVNRHGNGKSTMSIWWSFSM